MYFLNVVIIEMPGNQENVLESFIKVEPEEFEAISSDDLLRFNANIFSDPIVLVERLNFKIASPLSSVAAQSKNENISTETVQIYARKRIKNTGWNDPHSCSICQKVLTNRDTLKNHFEDVHSKSTRLLCDLCPKVYFSRKSIIRHMRMVHSNKGFACNVCDYKTAKKVNFQNHKMTHSAKVECPICKKQVSVLKVHMEYHKPKVSCPICQKMFQRRSLPLHMNNTHSKIKCTDCEEVLYNKNDLRRHKLAKHYEGEIFECHCGSVFNTKNILKTHQQEVHSAEKPICKICKKQFASEKYLKVHWKAKHLKTHGILDIRTKIRDLKRGGPFICDKCGSKHPTRSAFIQHNYYHHRSVTFLCDLCPRSFTHKTYLVRHIQRDHLKLQPYQCRDCEFKSFDKCNLETHMKRHGSRTECKICHKFVKNMRDHLRVHVKVKCPICSKILSKVNTPRHLRAHK